jgi:hypothetical protein
MPRPGRFNPAKESRYPVHTRLDGFRGLSGQVQIISPPPGFDYRIIEFDTDKSLIDIQCTLYYQG